MMRNRLAVFVDRRLAHGVKCSLCAIHHRARCCERRAGGRRRCRSDRRDGRCTVGAAVGAGLEIPNAVITSVEGERAPSVVVHERVVVGEPLPAEVKLRSVS